MSVAFNWLPTKWNASGISKQSTVGYNSLSTYAYMNMQTINWHVITRGVNVRVTRIFWSHVLSVSLTQKITQVYQSYMYMHCPLFVQNCVHSFTFICRYTQFHSVYKSSVLSAVHICTQLYTVSSKQKCLFCTIINTKVIRL